MAKQLTPLRRLFAQEYIKDLNGSESVVRAGFKVKDRLSAASIAYKLLGDVRVQDYIRELTKNREERVQLEADYVLEKLRALLEANVADVADFDNGSITIKDSKTLPREVVDAISEISINPTEWGVKKKIKLVDRVKVIDLAMRHLRLFAEDEQDAPAGNIDGFLQALDGTSQTLWDGDDGEGGDEE